MGASNSKVLISGASGLLGGAISSALREGGSEVWGLSRRATAHQQIHWNPGEALDPKAVSGFDTMIHLAGESVAGIWTAGKRRRIVESRVAGTRHLAEALARASRPPRILIAASATGYYGDRGDEALTESSRAGEGFLADVCEQWEAAALPAVKAGIRTVHLRTGIVLSPRGGALAKMLPAFRLGLGGRVGSGKQWWSWIHIDDVVGAVLHVLKDDGMHGAMNVTAPNPARNAEFTEILAAVLRRPAVVPFPAFVARLALGEAADGLLLASARVLPEKLQQRGYEFQYARLEEALRSVIWPPRTPRKT